MIPYNLPPHIPVVTVDADTVDERHYRRLQVGEVVRPWCEAYLLMPTPHWRLASCVGDKVSGRTAYRAPISLRAWVRILFTLAYRSLPWTKS